MKLSHTSPITILDCYFPRSKNTLDWVDCKGYRYPYTALIDCRLSDDLRCSNPSGQGPFHLSESEILRCTHHSTPINNAAPTISGIISASIAINSIIVFYFTSSGVFRKTPEIDALRCLASFSNGGQRNFDLYRYRLFLVNYRFCLNHC